MSTRRTALILGATLTLGAASIGSAVLWQGRDQPRFSTVPVGTQSLFEQGNLSQEDWDTAQAANDVAGADLARPASTVTLLGAHTHSLRIPHQET